MVKYDGGPLNGIIRLPVQVTVELLNALVTADAAIAAMAYGALWLGEKLRRGQLYTIYECRGVNTMATLHDDTEGWFVLVEPFTADAIKATRKEE